MNAVQRDKLILATAKAVELLIEEALSPRARDCSWRYKELRRAISEAQPVEHARK